MSLSLEILRACFGHEVDDDEKEKKNCKRMKVKML